MHIDVATSLLQALKYILVKQNDNIEPWYTVHTTSGTVHKKYFVNKRNSVHD